MINLLELGIPDEEMESQLEIAEYVQDLIEIGRNLAQIKEAIARYFTNLKWNAHFMDVWIKNMESS